MATNYSGVLNECSDVSIGEFISLHMLLHISDWTIQGYTNHHFIDLMQTKPSLSEPGFIFHTSTF